MKVKLVSILVALALVLAGVALPVFSQGYNTQFTTSITYQNVDTTPTSALQILFYAAGSGTPIVIPRPNLNPGAGTSLFVGSLSEISPGFQGSAVIQSDKRLVATLVQVPQNSPTVKNRPLSNGMETGSPNVLLATVLKNQFSTTTRFSVQVTDSEANNLTIKFYDTSAQLVHTITRNNVPSGSSFYVDAGTISQLGTSFNGSAVIEARRGNGSDGAAVASAMELSTTGPAVSAFEGVSQGATTVYMPSALCNAFGGYNSSFAVQNTDLNNSTTVTVAYSNGVNHTRSIGPGAKASFVACNAPGMPAGFSGSATVTSTSTPIVAIGKVYGLGTSTAFLGVPSGAAKLALPYVRWTQSYWDNGQRQRAFIAVQNIGSNPIPAGALSIRYVDRDGNTVVTHTFNQTINVGEKVNSNPYFNQDPAAAEFGYYQDGGFGGSAIVECTAAGCQVAAVVRIQSKVPADGSTVGEDYNGIPVP